MNSGWYYLESTLDLGNSIKLNNGAVVNLILCDGVKLTVGMIDVSGNTLNIYGQQQGTGTLVANSGINGYKGGAKINIYGGNIVVATDTGNAALGGESGDITENRGNGGIITINGGTVSANSTYGAAIGGGRDGNGGKIIINGGTVKAYSKNAAAIGGGRNGAGGIITVNGGTVTAVGGYNSPGIGGGSGDSDNKQGAGGSVTINGGKVTAIPGSGCEHGI